MGTEFEGIHLQTPVGQIPHDLVFRVKSLPTLEHEVLTAQSTPPNVASIQMGTPTKD